MFADSTRLPILLWLHIVFKCAITQVCITKAYMNSDMPLETTASFLGHRSQRLQWPIVITRCPASVVRPSVVRRPSVRRPLDNLHFQLLLQNRLIDFDETLYGWSTQGPLQVLLFFGQIRPGADPAWADPGRGQNRSRGSPSSKNFFFRPEGYSNKPNA